MKRKKSLIGGNWVDSNDSFWVKSPYTGENLAEICSVEEKEIEKIIFEAKIASKEMRKLPRFRIARGLRKISEGIAKRKNEFAEIIALESAKPLIVARGEVERGINTFAWAASEAERWAGELIPIDSSPAGKGKFGFTLKVPKGVIYGITPFNFPLNLVAHKVAPALASRNAIIIKPSEKTPLTALLLGEVFLKSGFPKNAFQVAPMRIDFIESFLNNEGVNMVSFTGSEKVGWMLKNMIGKKDIALELGGNAPVIIDESSDLEDAINKTVTGAFVYSGQVCISVQRAIVQSSLVNKFENGLIKKAKKLKTGDPLNENTQISVMINKKAAERAKKWVDEAIQNGAELLLGNVLKNNFLSPTILKNVDPEMRVVSEEVFAPVLVIEEFSEFPEAVSMANNSRFGLQVGVFTKNLENSHFASENLEYGGVIINDVPTFRVDNMPYGGLKNSGFGREGVKYAMEEMTDTKLVVQNF